MALLPYLVLARAPSVRCHRWETRRKPRLSSSHQSATPWQRGAPGWPLISRSRQPSSRPWSTPQDAPITVVMNWWVELERRGR